MQQASAHFIYVDISKELDGTAQSKEAVDMRFAHVADLLVLVQMFNLAFQKRPQTSHPLPRTKDNTFTVISHMFPMRREIPQGYPPLICPAVLWAPPGDNLNGPVPFIHRCPCRKTQ